MKLNAANKCLPSKFLDTKVLQIISFELPTSFLLDEVFWSRGMEDIYCLLINLDYEKLFGVL